MTRKLGLWAKKAFAALVTVAMLGILPCESVQAVSANGAIAKGIDVSKHNGAAVSYTHLTLPTRDQV